MAKRTLQDLQRQYGGVASSQKIKMRPGGRGPGAAGIGGKPKNARHTIQRLLQYVKPYRGHLVLVLLFMLLSTVTSLVGGYMMAPIIDRLAGRRTETLVGRWADGVISACRDAFAPTLYSWLGHQTAADVLAYLLTAIGIMLVVYLVGVAATYLQSRLMLSVSQGTIESIRNDLFDKVQALPVRFFDRNPTGEVMSRFTNDVDNIGTMLDNSMVSLISGSVTLIGTFIFMVTTNWVLTLVTVFFIPIFSMGGMAIAKRSRKYYKGQQAALGAVNGYIEETVTGQKVIKTFNHEALCEEEFGLLNDDLRGKQFKANFYGGIMGPIMGNTSQISYAITVGVGGILMATTGFTPGALTVFAGYSRQFSMPINNLSQQMTVVFSALAGAERVFAVMDAEPEAPDRPDARPADGMRGYVKMQDVTFGYDPDKTVLHHIDLYAKPGQKIAFVGSTGAGKTTITNLLNRFYDVEQGAITVDDVNIQDYRREDLRRNIAMVLQDTHLFTGTVRENIRYGRLDATDEEVEAAAKTASAHSFIMRLEHGYDTVIEGDGTNLSQGQRQLLNIARAALSKAPILVLDEATSSVDTRTERHIEHGLDRLMQGRTTFVIAHRLSTVRNANAIMVLEHGEIIERGDHDDLLAQKGRYWQLYTGAAELD